MATSTHASWTVGSRAEPPKAPRAKHGCSWRVGSLAGIDLNILATFFLLLVWVAVAHWLPHHDALDALCGVLLIMSVFAVVVLHELGHPLVARHFGIRTFDITLLPIGGVARLERMPENPKEELLVALAGPAVNVALALLLGTASHYSALDPAALSVAGGGVVAKLMWINVGLAVFNMVPAFPMDGWRVFRALRRRNRVRRRRRRRRRRDRGHEHHARVSDRADVAASCAWSSRSPAPCSFRWRRDRGWLYERPGHLRRCRACTGGLSLHSGHVRRRHSHRVALVPGEERLVLDVVKPLALGFLFGWSLHKAGLTHYARIVNVYRLRDMIVGAIVFGLLQPSIMPTLARVGTLGRVTVAGLAGASPWLVLLVFGQLVALALMLTARVGRKAT